MQHGCYRLHDVGHNKLVCSTCQADVNSAGCDAHVTLQCDCQGSTVTWQQINGRRLPVQELPVEGDSETL